MWPLPLPESNVHLIKLERVLLSAVIGHFLAITIENVLDKVRPSGLWQPVRPCDQANRGERSESRVRPEIPRVIFGRNAQDAEATTFRQLRVFLWRESQVRIGKISKVITPSCGLSRLFDDCFQAFASAGRDEPKLRLTVRF